MSRPPPAWLALLLSSVSVLLILGSLAAVWWMPGLLDHLYEARFGVHVADTVGALGVPVVAGIVGLRRPDHRYAWLLVSFGLSFALIQVTTVYAALAATEPGLLPLGGTVGWLSVACWLVWLAHQPFLLLLFPDGRLPSDRWRWFARTMLVVGVATLIPGTVVPGQLGTVAMDNPYGVGGVVGQVATVLVAVGVIGIFLGSLTAGVSVVLRHRHARDTERLQMRWFAWAAALYGVLLLGTGAGALVPDPLVNAVLQNVGLVALAAAIGIAVLRYRLYEIDRLISRSVTYLGVTVILGVVYAATVVTLRAVLGPLTGSSDLAVAASTLAVAALFGPLRRRLQTAVDHRFHRARYDGQRIIEAFAQRRREEVDIDRLVADVQHVTGQTLKPSHASVWMPGRPSR